MLGNLLNLGTGPATGKDQRRKMRIVNLASLLTAGLFLFFTIVLICKGLSFHAAVYVAFGVFFTLPLLINRSSHPRMARAVLLCLIAVALIAVEFVIRSNSRDVFIVCLMLLGVFRADTRREAMAVYTGTLLLFTIIKCIPMFFPLEGIRHESQLAFWFNILFSSGGLFLIVQTFKTDGKRYEAELARTNADLEAKRSEAEAQRLQLEKQAEALARRNTEVQTVNKDLQDSIRYARRIQNSMLLTKEQLREHLPESLVFFKPKDVLSGDFYWLTEVDGLIFVAVADCTGHGVPGAMMTVMGNNLLHQAVGKDGLRSPAAILTELDRRIEELLRQRMTVTDAVTDGMDIALVRIDRSAGILTFSSAKRPMYAFHGTGGDLTEYTGSRRSIGGQSPDGFTDLDIPFAESDIFYLTSDGYVDQFGPQGKFLAKRFRRLLQEIHRKPMAEQHRLLNETLLRWKVTEPQTDDIIVFGFRPGANG